MANIEFLPSIALEAICFIQKASLGEHNDERWMKPDQISEIKRLTAELPAEFIQDCLGMSTLSLIISTATDNALEEAVLDDLIEIFKHVDILVSKVKTRMTGDFTASYVHPMLDWLADGYAKKYIDKLEQLKAIGFEAQYRQRILPLVEQEIRKSQALTANDNYQELFDHIAGLKCCESITHTKIFVSFFSSPTAFTLYNGAYLMCFSRGNPDFYTLTAHELMHGFADNELTGMYLRYVASDAYLCEMHRRLIEEMHSGDEEEFTMAAEYYLCSLSGKYEKAALLDRLKKAYGGCCPTAVIVFDLLTKEKSVPTNYTAYLKEQFVNRRLPEENIREYVDGIM